MDTVSAYYDPWDPSQGQGPDHKTLQFPFQYFSATPKDGVVVLQGILQRC